MSFYRTHIFCKLATLKKQSGEHEAPLSETIEVAQLASVSNSSNDLKRIRSLVI